MVACAFWAVLPGRGPTPFEVDAVPFIHVKHPSIHSRLIVCHVDHLGQL